MKEVYKNVFGVVVLVSGILVSCNSNSQERMLDADLLLKGVQVLSHDSLEGRGFGRVGNHKAQQYIRSEFEAIGVEPLFGDKYIQTFDYPLKGRTRQYMFPIEDPGNNYENVSDTLLRGGNVAAMIKGQTDKIIVITGHLDHMGIIRGEIFNGADDDASGTSALMALAKYFKGTTPKHTLVFAAVDAEEIGSPGCKYMLDNFPLPIENVVLNVNMDMISHNDKNQLWVAGLHHYPQLDGRFNELDSPIELLFGHDDPNDKKLQDWTGSSDHRIFHERDIPFIYFGVDDHKDYHKPTDVFENINQEFYIDVVKLISKVIERYDSTL